MEEKGTAPKSLKGKIKLCTCAHVLPPIN